eukprot:Hpha_TRINITY_DN1104_c0_g1::TRINITY_DN1104_c0_g1_i2::g.113184::m.113184
MPPRRLRFVSLDCTGTLFHWRGSVAELYAAAIRSKYPDTGITAETLAGPLHRSIREHFKTLPFFGHGQGGDRVFWEVCARKGITESGPAGAALCADKEAWTVAFDEIYDTFRRPGTYRVYPDVLPFIEWASSAGLTLGTVSNSGRTYGEFVLPGLGLKRYFNQELYTGVEGRSKDELYGELLKRFDVSDPEECLHIGDDSDLDFAAARKWGMRAVLLDRSNL